jgi:glycosyltransferase involved in cell wall biosynthesis
MNKIKILFTICNFDTAGSGKVLLDLATSLDKNIFEPEICCNHSKGKFFQVVKNSGLKVYIFDVSTSYYPLPSLLWRVWQKSRFFRKHKFDLIHSWHWNSDFTEPLAAKFAGVKFVYTKKAMGWGNKAWHIRTYLSDQVVTINNEMNSLFYNNSKKAVLIPIDLDSNHYKPDAIDDKKTLNKSADDFFLISIANFVPVKGIEYLIDAVDICKDKIPDLKVLLVGDDQNEYGKHLHELVEKKQLNSIITFEGKVLDVRPYLDIADIFIIPSKDEGKKEGMPMAPVEAMAHKTIVLGSDITGINFILKDSPDLLFNPNSPEALAEKILHIYI